MRQFSGRNINEVYFLAMNSFIRDTQKWCNEYPSRNGRMLEMTTPVASVYWHPRERVLFDEYRDCNPFLHFFESLWMLAGKNDLKFLTQFTKTFEQFSDDGETLHGAYGHRWRHHFGFDQLEEAALELRNNPQSRRVVTQMWDPYADRATTDGKDVPCNTSIFWRVRNGALDMLVSNRSNDAIWGAYGANVVHFSMLHEYMSLAAGVKTGVYTQVSNSLHVYPDLPVTDRVFKHPPEYKECPYGLGQVSAFPLMWGPNAKQQFDEDLKWFFRMDPDFDDYGTSFFSDVVVPMWRVFKDRDAPTEDIAASDWRLAVEQWLKRRGQR